VNHWTFVVIAYALTIAGTLGLIGFSFAAMRRAEREAAALRDRS